jgi:hypothetical protein
MVHCPKSRETAGRTLKGASHRIFTRAADSEIHSMLAVCHFASRIPMFRKMLFESNRLMKHRIDGRRGGFWSEAVS